MGSRVETLIRSTVTKGVEAVAAFNRRRLPTEGEHPFLTGIHRPMSVELTLNELEVEGVIPAALDGRYLRIGPNPVVPDPVGYHWFIGDGMVHGVRLADGRALWYRNRWIRSKAVGAALGIQQAPGPRHGNFETVNTNVAEIAGRTWALVEAGSYPVELSETLDEQRYNPFDGTLAGSFSAHPHLDPLTGEQHAICYEATQPGEVRHVVIDRAGHVIRELAIPVTHGPMIHDCAITARYAIILDLPVTFSMKALICGHGLPYRWNPDHPARIGLLPRGGGAEDIIWCPVTPGYVFHVANAYDLPDGRLVVDVCAYETMFDGDAKGPDAASRGLERWTIDPVARSVSIRTIDSAPQEFPRVDERFFGQPYRYVHTIALAPDAPERFGPGTSLYRHDLETGGRAVHEFGPGRHPGEFVFVPAAPDGAEGEGWMIGLVVDVPREETELVILDAMRFAQDPVARIHIPHRVPPGFHGNWLPAAQAARRT
ncbi:8'-apo-carotenoid 13,14-cleaving dioxygenase [Flavisphingomonas formosensis]|uniref:8'-apo-carotenoid 13,14-cleaving dioxygenase n=1 Tax=Flavisphingomonas formosensis TaxID=861534 RepID=UPI0012FC7FBC|nr:carotenoid oxygenase family protein [Sphingomonas formosensis]